MNMLGIAIAVGIIGIANFIYVAYNNHILRELKADVDVGWAAKMQQVRENNQNQMDRMCGIPDAFRGKSVSIKEDGAEALLFRNGSSIQWGTSPAKKAMEAQRVLNIFDSAYNELNRPQKFYEWTKINGTIPNAAWDNFLAKKKLAEDHKIRAESYNKGRIAGRKQGRNQLIDEMVKYFQKCSNDFNALNMPSFSDVVRDYNIVANNLLQYKKIGKMI